MLLRRAVEMKIGITIVLSALFAAVACYDNITIGELPSGVAEQLLSCLAKKIITDTGGCGKPHESDIQLVLYTRTNANNPLTLSLTNPTAIDPRKKLIVLIHGWISNPSRFVPETKDAYLKRYDANVITVDWSKLALKFYTTSVCYVPKVAEVVADFLCLLEEKMNMPVNRVHLVGHSLGGQMAGFIGRDVAAKCGKRIGRITAMDPAGPLYQGLPTSERLDASDAMFVDVIHTNAGVLGYWGNCGHADFYVNCGTMQLGCLKIKLSLKSIKEFPVSVVTCHHSRSVDYMTESILHAGNFKGRTCKACPFTCGLSLLRFGGTRTIMGEDCPSNATGGYMVVTNLKPPFGGPLGFRKHATTAPSLKKKFNGKSMPKIRKQL